MKNNLKALNEYYIFIVNIRKRIPPFSISHYKLIDLKSQVIKIACQCNEKGMIKNVKSSSFSWKNYRNSRS